MSDKTAWLKNVKEGDDVAISSGGSFMRHYTIAPIDRITPTGRIKVGGKQYDKNGREMGNKSSWTRPNQLHPVTQDIKDSIEKSKLVTKLHGLKLEDLTVEQLRSIAKMVDDNNEGSEKRD